MFVAGRLSSRGRAADVREAAAAAHSFALRARQHGSISAGGGLRRRCIYFAVSNTIRNRASFRSILPKASAAASSGMVSILGRTF